MSAFVQVATATGPPVQIGATRLIPEVRIVRQRLPFGGLVLNRPTAVLVEGSDGDHERLPIRDLTRFAQLAALLVPLPVWLAARCIGFAQKEPVHA
jgi:hypothetical protein